MSINNSTILKALLIWALVSYCTQSASALYVRIETTLGVVDVELFDNEAPLTVANFMNYVNDGDYNDSFFHRSVPGFVLQGGGFRFVDAPTVQTFDEFSAVNDIRMARASECQ